MLSMKCPNCGDELEVPEGLIGQCDTCPNCRQEFRVQRDRSRAPDDAGAWKAAAVTRERVDDWTPAIGWRRAATLVGIRMLICAAVAAGGLTLLALMGGSLGVELHWRFVAMAGGLMGVPMGFIISSGHLVDRTGLSGKELWLLILVNLVVMSGVMTAVAITFFNVSQELSTNFLSSSAIAAMAVSIFRLIAE